MDPKDIIIEFEDLKIKTGRVTVQGVFLQVLPSVTQYSFRRKEVGYILRQNIEWKTKQPKEEWDSSPPSKRNPKGSCGEHILCSQVGTQASVL